MKIVSIGGGPAGLYFSILMKRADPAHVITVHERNQPDDTFGFGVVFSDATLENLAQADRETYDEIRRHFAHWDDIHIHFRGSLYRSTGHGFCGLERRTLLEILQRRAAALGVELRFGSEIKDPDAVRAGADLVLGVDGVGSLVRQRYADAFGPTIDLRPNRFTWLGTSFPFPAFTFYFKDSPEGLWRIHAYRYQEGRSTFIAECTAATFARTGLGVDDEDGAIAYLEQVFATELAGHRLIKNRSIWRNFPNIRNRVWHHDNVVLMGDAAHTAHFSIGSGTKLAMEDAIALRDALAAEPDVAGALRRYDRERRPKVEGLQRAAQVSLEWFEHTERYQAMAPVQFFYSLMTRSLRVNHAGLGKRDGELVAGIEAWLAAAHGGPARRPREIGLALGTLALGNRRVAVVDGPVSASFELPGAPAAVVVPAAGASEASLGALAARARALGASPWFAVADAAEAARAIIAGAAAIVWSAAALPPVASVPVVARVTIDPLDPAAVLARGRALVAAGVSLLWLGRRGPPDGAADVLVSDLVRNELGVATLVEGLAEPSDQDSAIAAGRADLIRV